jgi:IS5 family transposase
MNELMPWDQLEAVIEPFYLKAGNVRRPYPLFTMFRIHCM